MGVKMISHILIYLQFFTTAYCIFLFMTTEKLIEEEYDMFIKYGHNSFIYFYSLPIFLFFLLLIVHVL